MKNLQYEQTSLDLIPHEANINQNKTVQIANEFITAKYKLNILPIKLLYIIISALKQNEEKQDQFFKYRFNIKELAKSIGIYNNKRRNQKEIVSILREIMTTRLMIIERYDEKVENCIWLEANFLSSLKYLGDGSVEIVIDPIMHKYFLNLKNRFTLVEIHEILSLDSSYAVKIYQLLKQYINFGKRKFTIDELREILMVKNKYEKYVDLHRYVIKPAVEKLNEKSSLFVSYITDGGRGKGKTTEITFFVKEKPIINTIDEVFSNEEKNLFYSLLDFNISQKTAYNLIQSNNLEVIKNNLDYVINTKTPKRNKGAFLISAIRNDYASNIYKTDKESEIKKFFTQDLIYDDQELSIEWENKLKKIQKSIKSNS